MPQYIKKPVVIEAFKWTGCEYQEDDPLWIIQAIDEGVVWFESTGVGAPYMMIKTLEGDHRANLGDYIIQGIKGEIYPCKPDIFEATYEARDHDPVTHDSDCSLHNAPAFESGPCDCSVSEGNGP